MKIGTGRMAGRSAVVVETGEGKAVPVQAFRSVDSLLTAPPLEADAAIQQAISSEPEHDIADLEWLPPIVRPGKMLCVALNSRARWYHQRTRLARDSELA